MVVREKKILYENVTLRVNESVTMRREDPGGGNKQDSAKGGRANSVAQI